MFHPLKSLFYVLKGPIDISMGISHIFGMWDCLFNLMVLHVSELYARVIYGLKQEVHRAL